MPAPVARASCFLGRIEAGRPDRKIVFGAAGDGKRYDPPRQNEGLSRATVPLETLSVEFDVEFD